MRVYSAEPTLPSGLLVSRCGPGGKTDDLEGSAYGARGIETHCGHTNPNLENHPEKGSPRGAVRGRVWGGGAGQIDTKRFLIPLPLPPLDKVEFCHFEKCQICPIFYFTL